MAKQTVSPARLAARKGLESAIRAAVDQTLAAGNKIGTLATAIAGCIAAGISADETRAHARRATIAHVMGCEMAAADKYDAKGAERPEKLERALVAFRQCWSRAKSIAETGESSVRKAKAKRKPRPTSKPAAAPAASVPASITAVHAPMTSDANVARTFLLDTLALLERSEKSMAKALGGTERAALAACLAALRPLRVKEAA